MKKIFLLFAAAVMTAGVVFAQDINQATENYNNGAMELQMGNKESALNYFQTALTMAEALGEEGTDIATNCKNTIPAIMASIAKDLIKAELEVKNIKTHSSGLKCYYRDKKTFLFT